MPRRGGRKRCDARHSHEADQLCHERKFFWDYDDDLYDENGELRPAHILAKQQAFAAFVLAPSDDAIIRCVVEKEICYMLDLRRSDRMDKYYSDAGSWADDGPPCDPDDDDGFVGGGDAGLAGGF